MVLMVLMKTILANFVVVGNGQVGAMDVNRVEEGGEGGSGNSCGSRRSHSSTCVWPSRRDVSEATYTLYSIVIGVLIDNA